MRLTLSIVAKNPSIVTTELTLFSGDWIIFRPLVKKDLDQLTAFLGRLSPSTRRFCDYPSYDLETGREFCSAINKYDKLRFVVENKSNDHIIALLEFSFGIPEGDLNRFTSYGIQLSESTDCRFGPCITDEYQNMGLGSILMPIICDIAHRFGKKRMILWGGVLSNNSRAIHFYQKHGFQYLGSFTRPSGQKIYDMVLNLAE